VLLLLLLLLLTQVLVTASQVGVLLPSFTCYCAVAADIGLSRFEKRIAENTSGRRRGFVHCFILCRKK
jgi:hypothetical protein